MEEEQHLIAEQPIIAEASDTLPAVPVVLQSGFWQPSEPEERLAGTSNNPLGIVGALGLLAVIIVGLVWFAASPKKAPIATTIAKRGTPMATAHPTHGPGSTGPTGPTPTPAPTTIAINPAGATATITFTRTTQAIAAPQQTFLVSTTSSAPFTAHVLTITGNQIESEAIVPPTVVNPDFNVDMTVTNTTSQTFYSQFWWTITATDGVNTCRPTVNVHIPANSVIHIGCGLDKNTFDPHMPALTWDDTTGIPGLEFVGQNAAWVKQYQEVPANCGDPTPAVQALQTYLENTLEDTKPSMAIGLGNSQDTIDDASLTCTPPAGYQQYDGLAYNQFISGTRRWLYYFPQDVMNYQMQQLASQVPTTDILLSSSVCSLPTILDSSTDSGHVQCAATGTAAWNWTADSLSALAQQVAGKDSASATALLNATPGVVAGSAQITIAGGGTALPQVPSTIAITVNN